MVQDSVFHRHCVLVALAIGMMATGLYAQTKIKVLWLGGGTGSHNPAAMRDIVVPVFEKANLSIDYRTNESILNADSLKRYDVLFIYNAKKGMATDGTPDLTVAQEDALYSWVRAGHGIVGVHSANSSYLANPKFQDLFGGPYTVHGDTAVYKSITLVNPTHPALKDVLPPPATGHSDYWDEGREVKFTQKDTLILARANLAKGGQEPWTWVRPEGKGWVYYTSSGHDARVWTDTHFQNQLIQALRWGASLQPTTGIIRLKNYSGYRVSYLYPISNQPTSLVDITGSTLPQDFSDPIKTRARGRFILASKGGR
jgi:type 1 glutamine amidotransferase